MIAESVYIAVACSAVTAICVFAVMHHKNKKSAEQLGVLGADFARVSSERDELRQQFNELQQEKHQQSTTLAVGQEKISLLEQQLAQISLEKTQLVQQRDELQVHNTELKTRQEEKELHFSQQLRQLDEQKEMLKKEFESLANKVLADKGKALSDQHKQSIEGVLSPFKQQIQDFRTKVEDIHHKDTQQQAQLKTELQQLQTLNKQMTEEAHQLATALKGQKKVQGNWGELVLENVLERSGLQLGKDYEREVSFTTSEGRSRPDVIVYLPDNKHLVIDAKASLNAYTRYVNAEDALESKQALKEHAQAISDRIRELSDRNYYDLPGLNTPELVFMFIPIESAFVEALKFDESLFQKALEKNVLVATPTTLLTSLNIVRQLWRFEDQNRHTAELAEKAAKVYDKLNGFILSMETLGKSLDKARDSYDKAYGQLYSGRGNLVKQASELKKLGVAVKTEISQNLVDKADLELNHLESENGADKAP